VRLRTAARASLRALGRRRASLRAGVCLTSCDRRPESLKCPALPAILSFLSLSRLEMSSFTFTFTWPAATKIAPLSLQMADDNLKARDPEGKSLIAVKLRNPGGKDRSIEFMALGPREKYDRKPISARAVIQLIASML